MITNHTIVLPQNWNGIFYLPPTPSFSTSSQPNPMMAPPKGKHVQESGWPSYIASLHAKPKNLVLLAQIPSLELVQRKKNLQEQWIENGLLKCHKANFMYLQSATDFAYKHHHDLVNSLVQGWVMIFTFPTFEIGNLADFSTGKSHFRDISDTTIRRYRDFLTRTISPAIRSVYAQLHEKLHFGDFQTIGTPKQCQALLALYKLFIETKGNPDELELVVLCHRYYEALLRVHGIGAAKVACPSDQALCLGALFSDGQFQMANNTT